MEQNAYFVFSFENYLEAVNFGGSILKEQIAYQLYYVTKIAKLRKDMTPHIISDRLNDQIRILNEKYVKGQAYQNLELTTPESVAKIMEETPEYFAVSPHIDIATDRNGKQLPYILTEKKEEELNRKLHYHWKKVINKQYFYDKKINQFVVFLFFLIIATVAIINNKNSQKLGISWQEYQEKVHWENIDNYERAKFILYYITKIIEFNDDMTANVLSDRLVSLKCSYICPDSIDNYFKNSELVIPSDIHEGAYVISSKGEKVLSKEVGIVSPYVYDGNVNFIWVWKNQPDIYVLTLITLCPFLIGGFRYAYNQGKKVNLICGEKDIEK